MKITHALIVPHAVGLAVSVFLFFTSVSAIVTIIIRAAFVEELTNKKKKKPAIPICVTVLILSCVSCILFTKWIDRSYDGIVLHSAITDSVFYSFAIVGFVALAVIVIRGLIKDYFNVTLAIIPLIACIAAIVLLIHTVFTDVRPTYQDYRDKAYVTYTGEFKTTTVHHSKQRTELLDGSGIKVYGSGEYQGTFSGTVVYTERSHIRLEVRYSD